MKFFLLNRIARQSGFTLIELSLALTITSVIGIGIISTTQSISNTNNRNIAHTMAFKEVETAVHFINRDVQQAQKIDVDGEDYWLKLTWVSWDNNTSNQVVYVLDNGTLTRVYSVDNDVITETQVARFINNTAASAPNPTPISLLPEKTWTFELTAQGTSGSMTASETREIKVIPRPGS
jgi:prepilin-type N-terminal cleavage/methylation domain-containing protein